MSYLIALLVGMNFTAALPATDAGDSQPTEAFSLKDNDRVVFFGDSTVEDQRFSLYVETFVRTRYPELKTRFFNVGVRNLKTQTAQEHYVGDVVKALSPTIVVLSIGLYDVKPPPKGELDLLEEFRKEYDRLIEELQALDVQVIILTPPQSPGQSTSLPGTIPLSQTLGDYARIVREVAAARNIPTIDWYKISADVMQYEAQQDTPRSRRKNTGITPTPFSHVAVAAELLKYWHASPIKVEINVDWASGNAQASHGQAEVSQHDENGLTVALRKLPMPWLLPRIRLPENDPGDFPGAEMCQYLFRVTGAPDSALSTGLKNDPIPLSPEKLAAGINIFGWRAIRSSTESRELLNAVNQIHSHFNKYWRQALPNRPQEPELQPAFESHLQTLTLYTEGYAQIALRLDKHFDAVLRIEAGGATTEPSVRTQSQEGP